MKAFNFKQLLPHLIALGIFLIVTIIYCKPSLEQGVILKQDDVVGFQGVNHQSNEYREKHGHYPLWATSMFCGMPAYQIAIEGHWNPLAIIDKTFQLWLPEPLNFFMLACMSFYFLGICLGIRPFASILGALGFAFCSFSPIVISAGHISQILSLCYAPAVLGATILIFDKKYWAGFSLLTILTTLQINQSHQQITFYLLLVMIAMTTSYAIRFIRNKETGHLIKSIGLMAVAALLSIAVSAITLFPAFDFSKDSKRGGQLIMDNSGKQHEKVINGKTTGLSKDYAFQWSYGKMETWSLLFPGVMGYGSHYAQREGEDPYLFPKLGEDSKTANFLIEKINVAPDQAANFALQKSMEAYWGDQPFTTGPIYLGAIICLLFFIGMFYLDNKHKWWILSISFIAILLSWGGNFPQFNYWVFDNIPLYNKFRVPTMALTIPQMILPIMAALVMEKLLSSQNANDWTKIRKGLIATAVIFGIGISTYMMADYSKENKDRTKQFNEIYSSNDPNINAKISTLNSTYPPKTDNRLYEEFISQMRGNPDAQKNAREFLSAVREDRKDFFKADLIRSFIFMLLASAFIVLYIKRKINDAILIIGITLLTAIDLLDFDFHYLNSNNYTSKDTYEENQFPLSQADQQILQDTDPNFRIFNTTAGLDESKTSYYHKSIGGYHPAKIGIYDDLITYQLSKQNMSVINMLNTKYVIQQQQDGKPAALRNPGALGNAWFVKGIVWVKGPVAEMKGLDNFNPSDTAVADEKYRSIAGNIGMLDSTDIIKMKTFDNDTITYSSQSKNARIAIFSEIYYKDWHAYIDNKPVSFFKANYVLRAMNIPAGKHDIKFIFEPAIFFTSKLISAIASWVVTLIFLGFILFSIKKTKK